MNCPRWIASDSTALDLSDHDILEREFMGYDGLRSECQKRVASRATS